MSADNEALVRRFFEEFCNRRRAELADELIAADYVAHGPLQQIGAVPIPA